MIYVLSDIHGNAKNFDAILQQICLQPEDTLYILGDVIDRHPDGIRILRKIMSMPNAKMLLGNHEYMMLEALKVPKNEISDSPWERNWPSKKIRLWYSNGGKVTHDYLKHIRKSIRAEIVAYLEALPVNIDIEVNGIKYKLVHGTLLENYGTGYRSYRYASPVEFAVWERLPIDAPVPEGYTLIFGHTPTIHYHSDNPLMVWYGNRLIGIDCGSGFPINENAHLEKGRLACLRLDDMKEFYSDGIAKESRR